MGTNNNILQIIKVRARKSKKNSVYKFLYAYFLPENLGNGNSNGGQQQHPPNNQGKIQDFQKVYKQTKLFWQFEIRLCFWWLFRK